MAFRAKEDKSERSSQSDEKVILNWLNSILAEVGERVSDIFEDFRDSHLFGKLVEALIGKKIVPPIRRREQELYIHKCENVNVALQALSREGFKVKGTSAQNIVDGDVKHILSLFWLLARRFALNRYIADLKHDEAGEEGEVNVALTSSGDLTKGDEYFVELLRWMNSKMTPANQLRELADVKNWKVIANLVVCLSDGKACSDYETWKFPEIDCLELALNAAQDCLNVPLLFSPTEATKISDVSWMLYYGQFLRYAVQKKRAALQAQKEEKEQKELVEQEQKEEEKIATQDEKPEEKKSEEAEKRPEPTKKDTSSVRSTSKFGHSTSKLKEAKRVEHAPNCKASGWGLQTLGVRCHENARFTIEMPARTEEKLRVEFCGPNGKKLHFCPHSDQTRPGAPNDDTFILVREKSSICKARSQKLGMDIVRYNFWYRVTTEGAYNLSMVLDGKPFLGSPFKFSVIKWRESVLRVFGVGLTRGVVGKVGCFLLEMNGEYGLIEISIDGPKRIEINVHQISDETYAIKFQPEIQGRYTVHVKHNEKEIPRSPSLLIIGEPICDPFEPESVRIVGDVLTNSKVRKGDEVSLTVLVPASVRHPDLAVTFSVWGPPPTYMPIKTTHSMVQDDECDQNICKFTTISIGRHLITANYGDVIVGSGPVIITVEE